MYYLLASIGVLVFTPLLHKVATKFARVHSVMEKVLLVALAVMVVGHILPEAYHTAGWLAIAVAFIGILIPNLLERYSHKLEHRIHGIQVIIAFTGLILHAGVDGAALAGEEFWHTHAASHVGHDHTLPWLVVLHRVPVALFLWWAICESYNVFVAGMVLAIMGISTIIGFMVGGHIFATMETLTSFALFQAFVAGSLIHLAWHRH